ncbi:hypothetical protein N8987_03595, partial [Crocinitomix sp.]|nr:hypothetical protein [Crocinitomix sp.]
NLFESPNLDYHLPSPLQVASIFKKSGLEYNSAATLDPNLADGYTTEIKQMLNFGVYSADMAYCVLNNQANEGRRYLVVITDLAAKIGMETVFENKDLMERFDDHMDNKDSIEVIMIDIHSRTEEYMDENDTRYKESIHFAGAWAEGMYLGVYDFENNKDKEDVGSRVAEQMAILENIIHGLEDPRNDGMELDWLVSEMKQIQTTFNNFASVKDYFNNPDANVLVLTNKENDSLGSLIKNLRKKITEE